MLNNIKNKTLYIWGNVDCMNNYVKDDFKKLSRLIDDNQIDSIVFYGFDEPYLNDRFESFLQKNNKLKITIYTHKDHPKWFFYNTLNYYALKGIKPVKLNKNTISHFLWLPGHTRNRIFKCFLIDELSKRNLLDKILYSWTDTRCDYAGQSKKFNFKYFDNKLKFLDNIVTKEVDCEYISLLTKHGLEQSPEVTAASLFDIVVEETKYSMFSEKTVRSIYNKKIPLVLSSAPFTCKKLKDLGFNIIDDTINYKYDEVTNIEDKVKLFIDQIEILLNIDIKTLYNDSRLLRENNFKNLINLVKQDPPFKKATKKTVEIRGYPYVL